ncbi:allergen V5/TPX-1 family protein [Pedobacter lusitanus]|uniref:Allergen V5/TPX-1 family protein n=1 Tax=Pedobacter lusitanus TaxID=1503925 RepID=A0A0D0GJD6_9SPHI|nr:CAP domain-containing protein [Pedobacter lusitanus]KIO77337.1 allergen V5/TPX-1 family protein [Pedobacter lusitanus]
MKFILIAFLLFFSGINVTNAQSSAKTWTTEELENANTAKNTSYLNEEEKKIILYMNLARTDGEKFFNTYFQDFVEAYNVDMQQYSNYNELKINRKDRYYRGLEKDLKDIKGLTLFSPDETLTWISQQHAKDMKKNNLAGHNSSDGRSVSDRIWKYYPKRAVSENLAFGFSKGLANVCMLLLDKNVPDLGHRKTILGTSYNLSLVGVNISTHPGYKYCAVIDFISAPPTR